MLTWDPRGFGNSGGEAEWDSPEYEARDVQALMDALATFPEAAAFHPLHHHDALRADGTSTRQRLYLYPENLMRLPPAQRRVRRCGFQSNR